MSFRGRYPSKFRRTGNFHGHERPVRGRPFKRRYYEEEADFPNVKTNREFVPLRGRGRQAEKEKNSYSNRGRGRPFNKYHSDRGSRPRSRGRFFRGRQNNFGGSRGRRFESPRVFHDERGFEKHDSDFHEGNEWDEDERHLNRRDIPPEEWYENEEEDESHYIEEEHIPFERRQRSPLTIHRRFDNEEFQQSPQRSIGRSSSHSRSRLRRSRSLERRSFSMEREQFDRLRPLERLGSLERRGDSFELRGRSTSIERRDSLTGFRRSRSIESRERLIEHRRSNSPYGRYETEERGRSIGYSRHSLDRSRSPSRVKRSRERVYQSSERERSISRTSRRSIERQIAYEKERLQQMLDHEKKIHEKRSESSIERFLDDCKRSFENNTKSHSVSRSNSFDGRDQRVNEVLSERSLSPFDQSYKRIENIRVERRRSLERSSSPIGRPNKYRRISGFSPKREKYPYWREDNRHIIPDKSNIERRSESPEYHRRPSSRHFSPEVKKRSEFRSSRSPVFREGDIFVEQREGHFLDEPFLERRERHFLGDPKPPFLGDHERDFLENRNPHYRGESSSKSRSITERNHFLEVGEGPFPENRSFSKDQRNVGNEENGRYTGRGGMHTSSHDIEYKKNDTLEIKMPVENLETPSVSHTGYYKSRKFHHTQESIEMGLSPISHTESFEKEDRYKNNIKEPNQELPSGSQINESAKTSHFGTERPNSTDSMKQFLAELENDDLSNERYILQEEDHNVKDISYGQSQRTDLTNKFPNKNISKFDEKTSTKSSYYDVSLTSASSEKHSKPFSENVKQDLFNAYEKSFLDQSYDAYNENIFQGRYEQPKNSKRESKPAKIEKNVSITKETPVSHVSKTSEFYSRPTGHPISSRPYNETCDKSYREKQCSTKQDGQYHQNVHTTDEVFTKNSTRQNVMPFPPDQAPMYPFQKLPNTMPFGSAVPSHQSTHISQYPEALTQSSQSNLGDKAYNQQQTPWKNQSAEFYNCPGMVQNVFTDQMQQNVFDNLNTPFSETGKQLGIFSNLQQSQIPNKEFRSPNKFLDNRYGNITNPWSATGGSNKNVPYIGDKRNKNPKQHNVKEVIVISDDEGLGTKYKENSDDTLVIIFKGNVIPTATTVEKYKNCTPTYDVLGKIFKGFVIYFGVKENSELQKDPIEVLKESFITSEGFEKLDVEEKSEYKPSSASKHVCELRWKGLLLSRGEGSCKEEARSLAGISLINALAKTCFIIQAKYGYYNNGRYPVFMLKNPEKPGYYKMVKRDEIIKSVVETIKKLRAQGLARGVDATHIDAVISYMDECFHDPNTHCELIFGPTVGMEYTVGELKTLSRHAAQNGLQTRWFHGTKRVKVHGQFLCVSRKFSPQALFHYMLAEKGDTVRYRMFPPQGPRIDLLTAGNVYSPNMIKTILHMIGPDGNILSDFNHSVNIVPHEDPNYNTWDEPNPSNFGSDQFQDRISRNIHSSQNQNYPYQSQSQNPNSRFQDLLYQTDSSFQNTNTQNREFNSLTQGGYERNIPFR